MEDQIIKKKKNWPVIILGFLVVCLGGYITYNYYAESAEESDAKSSITATPAQTSTSNNEISKITDEGVTWQKPEKLGDLKLFSEVSGGMGIGDISYFKVGTTSTGGEIIDAQFTYSMRANFLGRIIKRDGQYYLIAKNSDQIDNEEFIKNKELLTDNDYAFKSLLNDSVMHNGKTELVSDDFARLYIDSDQKEEKITTTKWGDLYLVTGKEIDKSDGKMAVASYQLQLSDYSRVVYEPMPSFFRDDNTFDLTWSNDKGKDTRFSKMQTGGCGLGSGSFPLVVDKESLKDKTELGRNGDSIVYTSEDTSHPLIKIAYDLYNDDQIENVKSIEEFATSVGIAFWTDDYGQAMVYVNQDFTPTMECGKPVVYLYPESKTEVKVKVGAKITKSEPDYGSGWSGTAYPSGNIIVKDNSYPYLFWEGLGFGEYPAIKEGTVVASAKVESTIRSQLAYIGLNKTEISDFLEYWMPKMPNKNFVRLTWLQNKEMDELAPLSITPKPDSVIRVFLDFEGLDGNTTNIRSQQLTKGERSGFTAIEWGGLLVN